MSFPDDPRDISVSFAFGDTWRTSSPSYDQVSPGGAADDPGPVLGEAVITRGRVGDAAETTPTKVDGLSVRNEDGEYSPDNPYGTNYGQLVSGVPVQLAVDVGAGAVPLATIFADDFVPSWAGPGVDAKVAIPGMGVLERIGRLRTARSPLSFSILGLADPSQAPVDYWPMEDGPNAGHFSSALDGGPVLSVTDAELASVDDLPGSGSLATFTATTTLHATLSAGLPGVAGSASSWAVAWMVRFETLPGSTTTLMQVTTSGGSAERWVVTINGSTLALAAYNTAGTLVFSATATGTVTTGRWISLFLNVVVTGLGSAFGLEAHNSDGSLLGTALATGISSVGTPVVVDVPASSNLAGMSMGHLFTSGAAIAPNYLTDSPNALSAYNGETAAARIARLCAELGVTATIVNASGETNADDIPLGPQPIGTAIDVLRNAEDGGEGVLDETTSGKPRYTTNAALLNLTPIELDFTTHVADLFPLGIERDWRSAVTVNSTAGVSATVTNPVDTDAPAAALTRNVPDSAVANHAGWLGLIAFLRKPRYVVVLDLRANSAALALMPADLDLTNRRLQISGLPVEMVGPGPLDLLVVGTKQRIGADGWVVECHCEPYGPYRVRKLANTPPDDDLLDGWLIPDSCSLATGVDATATSWSVNISPLMTTSASDFPCRVLIGGEEVWITACSGAASPQTWTVTRGVNGIHKAHSAGAEIEFLDPIILTL